MTDDQAVFEQRAHELAAKAGITLDRDCPPEWADFVDAGRSDVLLQRGIAHVRERGLPEELADYLARSWVVHVETFGRCRTAGDVTMAASWARRHAKVAAAVLAMPTSGRPGGDAAHPVATGHTAVVEDEGCGWWAAICQTGCGHLRSFDFEADAQDAADAHRADSIRPAGPVVPLTGPLANPTPEESR
jgi:hypothetical protein